MCELSYLAAMATPFTRFLFANAYTGKTRFTTLVSGSRLYCTWTHLPVPIK